MALKPTNIFSRIAAHWLMNLAKGCLGCFLLQVSLVGFLTGFLVGILIGYAILL